jgi:hypothetical protein
MDLLEEHQRKTKESVITAALWLLTAVLGVAAALVGRRVILVTYGRFFPGTIQEASANPLSFLNILVTLPLAFLAIAIIIGGFEYHLGSRNKVGTNESYWMFTRTLAAEIGFLLLGLFL